MSPQTQTTISQGDYSAEQVADYFIHLASKESIDEGISEGVTPLKLQKLLYFAQAVSLSLYDKKLFNEDIEAWKYGPVISSLYHKYKSELNAPLVVTSGTYAEIQDTQTKELIEGVWELFGKYSAGELVEITHKHIPWKSVYVDGVNAVIPPESIRSYYKDIFELQNNSHE
jgi:uncharacterized phage-associated protein